MSNRCRKTHFYFIFHQKTRIIDMDKGNRKIGKEKRERRRRKRKRGRKRGMICYPALGPRAQLPLKLLIPPQCPDGQALATTPSAQSVSFPRNPTKRRLTMPAMMIRKNITFIAQLLLLFSDTWGKHMHVVFLFLNMHSVYNDKYHHHRDRIYVYASHFARKRNKG